MALVVGKVFVTVDEANAAVVVVPGTTDCDSKRNVGSISDDVISIAVVSTPAIEGAGKMAVDGVVDDVSGWIIDIAAGVAI